MTDEERNRVANSARIFDALRILRHVQTGDIVDRQKMQEVIWQLERWGNDLEMRPAPTRTGEQK